MPTRKPINEARLDQIVADAAKAKRERESGYREKALGMYPWICGRCAREFMRANVHELTVHHRNHNHDDNPADGSNWELLCLYCHDNEHQRYLDHDTGSLTGETKTAAATANPFADLRALLGKR